MARGFNTAYQIGRAAPHLLPLLEGMVTDNSPFDIGMAAGIRSCHRLERMRKIREQRTRTKKRHGKSR